VRPTELLTGAASRVAAYSGRASLTVLGIAIGLAALIALCSTAQSITAAIERQSPLGDDSNSVVLAPARALGRGRQARPISQADSRLLYQMEGVRQIVPLVSLSAFVDSCGAATDVVIVPVPDTAADVAATQIVAGRGIHPLELQRAADVCVLSSEAVAQLPCLRPGTSVRLARANFRIVGVAATRGYLSTIEGSPRRVLVPARTAEKWYGANTSRAAWLVVFDRGLNLEDGKKRVRMILRRQHRLSDNDADDFVIRDANEVARSLEQVGRQIRLFLFSILAVSIVVSAVGIANSVLTAVAERRQEIGMRRAVGATRRAIVVHFVLEAAMLVALGTIGGVVLGAATTRVMCTVLDIPPQYDLRSSAYGILLCWMLSLLAAFGPALHGARLAPSEAVRSE
jgi:putative ABC transport system permease protein